MKRTVIHEAKSSERLATLHGAGYVAFKGKVNDTFEDRVSDDIFDADDERAELGLLAARVAHEAI